MPHNRLESFRVSRYVLRIDGRDNHASIGDFGGIAAVSAHDAANRRADLLRVLQGAD